MIRSRAKFITAATAALLAVGVLTTQSALAQDVSPTIVFTVGQDAIKVVQTFYQVQTFLNCTLGGVCPESDAQQAADRTISTLSALYTQYDTDQLLANAESTFDDAFNNFGDPTAVTIQDETDLYGKVHDLFFSLSVKLSNLNANDPNQVAEAYILAPAFNMTAALLDMLTRMELASNHVPTTLSSLNNYRAMTLQTDEALVGSQSLWSTCDGSPGSMINTVTSLANTYPTVKLWEKFSDYTVVFQRANYYDCNPFHVASGQTLCTTDCSHNFLGFCDADTKPLPSQVYGQEEPKILPKMDRDPVVRTVRAAMEAVVGLAAANGAGLLWLQPSGEVTLWNVKSDTSYKSFDLANSGAPASGWQVAGTGDFNGDGTGDILWINPAQGLVGYWLMANNAVEGYPAAGGLPALSNLKAFVGDLDGDGVSDIVWTGTDSNGVSVAITWIMSTGSPSPSQASARALPPGVTLQALGNFEHGPGTTYRAQQVWRDGGGNYTIQTGGQNPASTHPTVVAIGTPVGTDWQVIGAADFNGDGFDDLLFWEPANGWIALWGIANDQETWTHGLTSIPASSGWSIGGISDANHDGIADIIWQHTSGVVGYWKMNTAGQVSDYTWTPTIPAGAKLLGPIALGPRTPWNVPAGPLWGSYCPRNFGFAPPEKWSQTNVTTSWLVGDIDGDGRADIMDVGLRSVGAQLSSGSGLSSEITAYYNASGSTTSTHGQLIGDVTGDGKADIVLLQNSAVQVMSATGNTGTSGGAFNNPSNYWGAFYGAYGTLIGDIDGDGKADLVALGGNYVGVIHSQGGNFGNYDTGLPYAFYGNHGTFLGDVNGDGKADLVALVDGAVIVALATGAATGHPPDFGTNAIWYSGTFFGANGTTLADVNGDGLADLVAFDNGQVRVIRSNGTGFGTPEVWLGTTFGSAGGVTAADVDGNGRADLVALTTSGAYISRSQ